MLRKLMKHELRATMRIMLPLYFVVFVFGMAAQFSVRHMVTQGDSMLNLLGGLLTAGFIVSIFGVCLMTLVLMIRRFQKNLLGDEGYLMFTLPVSVHSQIWSKLLVSTLWFFLTGLMVIAVSLLVVLGLTDLTELREVFAHAMYLFRELTPADQLDSILLVVEMLVMMLVNCCAQCLYFYAALAIGHSFSSHKLVWSVGIWFGLMFAVQLLSGMFMTVFVHQAEGIFNWLYAHAGSMQVVHVGLLTTMAGTLAVGAVFYLLTAFFLKKRLNLE